MTAEVAFPPRSSSRPPDTPAGLAVSCRNLRVRFFTPRRAITALQGMSLDVPAGEFLTLLGPSGCGKSTFLRLVADLIEPDDGEIRVFGAAPEAARLRRDIGFVFQDPALLPWRTALANVELPLQVAVARARRAKASPRELLELVGLKGSESAYPHELSGGMRQRVAIARTRPGLAAIISTRWPRYAASWMLWVTNSTVRPSSRQTRRSSSFRRSRVISSSAPNGSSISESAYPHELSGG